MQKVFVLDTHHRQLNPIPLDQANKLLSWGQAAVFRHFPLVLILKSAVGQEVEPLRLKIDPGSRTTGLAIVNDATGEVIFAANLSHRGHIIAERLKDRRAIRRSRRNRKTRYRAPRFKNRQNKKKGWLPPSSESRIANILTWVNRLRAFCPITDISLELVKFDLQKIENSEISGIEYQQGTLAGYEVREYLLEKWNHRCAYCKYKNDLEIAKVPLQIDHIYPRAKGGTDRISNLCLACKKCNQAKGKQDVRDFLKNKPDVLKRVLAQAKAPLKDAAAVNTIRWALYERLKAIGLPVECGSGGLTKYNRTIRNLPKEHWIDAVCVGWSTPEQIVIEGVHPIQIKAMGHGKRQICKTDKYGFPETHRQRKKRHFGFQTGDIVKAKGIIGRVTARASGQFTIHGNNTISSTHNKIEKVLQKQDGYHYLTNIDL